jgi:5-methylcytosine-specific restriction endonuclease McrA
MPLSRGGSNDPGNLQLLCPLCNHRKKDKHPDDWAKIIAASGGFGAK